jgi:hypothetical protein
MKRISYLLTVFGMIFVSCSQNDDDCGINIPKFQIDLNRISVSVDNNILLFENLDALYACTDYLNEIGEENFDAFEKAIGFQSFRSFNKNNSYPTNLIATMLNPENKIIVGDKLFEISNSLDSVSIFEVKPELNFCQEESSMPKRRISVQDNLYKIFPNDENFKSTMDYCGPNNQKSTISDFRVSVKIKIGNYDWVFWNVLEATISKGLNINSMEIGVYTVGVDFYRTSSSNCRYLSDQSSGTGLSYTISKSIAPLIAYNYEVEYWIDDGAYGSGTYSGIITCDPSNDCNK